MSTLLKGVIQGNIHIYIKRRIKGRSAGDTRSLDYRSYHAQVYLRYGILQLRRESRLDPDIANRSSLNNILRLVPPATDFTECRAPQRTSLRFQSAGERA